MPRHAITATLPSELTVSNRDVEFEVRIDDKLRGRLRISQGGVDWTKAHARTSHHLNWTELAKVFEDGR